MQHACVHYDSIICNFDSVMIFTDIMMPKKCLDLDHNECEIIKIGILCVNLIFCSNHNVERKFEPQRHTQCTRTSAFFIVTAVCKS